MLDVAEVSADDTVFDLGCGDGRIVIEAVKRRGARGVGIDLDPLRIRQGIENSEREGLGDGVRFIEEDLFQADIHEATVVTLFLYPDVNLRLRPKLLRDLEPGTRVVSYSHNMEQWLPDRSIGIRASYLHYWLVPGNMSGKWEGATQDDGRQATIRLDLHQKFQRLWGIAMIGEIALTVDEGVMIGGAFSAMARESAKEDGMGIVLYGIVRSDVAVGMVRNG